MILPLEWLGPHFQKLCWILIGTYQRSPKCFECSLTSLDHKLKDNINKVSNRIDDSNIECNSTLFCFYWTATGYLHQKDKKKVCSLFKSPSHIVTSIHEYTNSEQYCHCYYSEYGVAIQILTSFSDFRREISDRF